MGILNLHYGSMGGQWNVEAESVYSHNARRYSDELAVYRNII